MDIDSPPSLEESLPLNEHGSGSGYHGGHHDHYHLVDLPPLSASFPLPFRVLTLVGLAIFLWGSNLQILHSLGINPSKALGLQLDNETNEVIDLDPGELDGEDGDIIKNEVYAGGSSIGGVGVGSGASGSGSGSGGGGGSGHRVIYKMGLIYSAWVAGGWVVFRVLSGGEVESMESLRGLVGVVMIGAALGALVPSRGVGERERRALRRYVFPDSLHAYGYIARILLLVFKG